MKTINDGGDSSTYLTHVSDLEMQLLDNQLSALASKLIIYKDIFTTNAIAKLIKPENSIFQIAEKIGGNGHTPVTSKS